MDPDATLGRVVMERIAELRTYRRWVRAQPHPEHYADLAAEWDAELRVLLRLRREAARRHMAERVGLAAGDFYAGMPR
jgi:hypothetical protein